MQFRPVRIEHFFEELAPKPFELGKQAGLAVAALDRSGEGGGCDGGHDAFSLFSRAAFAALVRFSALKASFGLIY
jgi:hypothetical protein